MTTKLNIALVALAMATAAPALAQEDNSSIIGAWRMTSLQFVELAPIKIADFLRIRYGGTNDAKRHLGAVPAIRDAFVSIQAHLFR